MKNQKKRKVVILKMIKGGNAKGIRVNTILVVRGVITCQSERV